MRIARESTCDQIGKLALPRAIGYARCTASPASDRPEHRCSFYLEQLQKYPETCACSHLKLTGAIIIVRSSEPARAGPAKSGYPGIGYSYPISMRSSATLGKFFSKSS